MAHSGAFFGRESELESLQNHLMANKVISIVGPFGAGKTRLSKALIEDIEGALFLDLSEAVDNELALRTLAEAAEINLQNERAPSAALIQLGRFFKAQDLPLVVIDNAEQIVDFVREAISVWRKESPSTVFVITTREPVEAEGEFLFRLDGLDIDHAVALFVDRAERIGVALDSASSDESIRRIVESLDRLPLLVELAASRVDVFSLRDLLSDLDRHLLEIRTRDKERSERQATVVGAIDWSWSLLNSEEARALETLALFHGSFSLAALVEISEQKNIATLLGKLLEKSLVRREKSKSDSQLNRFSLYESVRIYLLEKYAPSFEAFVNYWGREASALCDSFPASRRALDEFVGQDFENVLWAFENSSGSNLESLAIVLDAYLEWRGPQALRARILKHAFESASTKAIKCRLGLFFLKSGNLISAKNFFDQRDSLEELFAAFLYAMVSRASDADEIFEALITSTPKPESSREFELLALANAAQGTRLQSIPLLKKARKFAQASKDELSIAKVLNAEGALQTKLGDFTASLRSYERALKCLPERSAMRDTISGNIGLIAHYNGDLERAVEVYSNVENSLSRAGLTQEASIFSANRAGVLIESNQLEAAREILNEASFVLEQFESESLISASISLANIAHLKGELAEARSLYTSVMDEAKFLSSGGFCYLALLELEENQLKKVNRHINEWQWGFYPVWDAAMACLCSHLDLDAPKQKGLLPRFVSNSLEAFHNTRMEEKEWVFTQLMRRLSTQEKPRERRIGIRRDGGLVEFDGREIDLGRRGPAKKLLVFLAESHLEKSGACFDLDMLFEAGWPGVKIDYESAHKRVYAAIGTLRRQGLEDVIETTDEGYRFFTDLVVDYF